MPTPTTSTRPGLTPEQVGLLATHLRLAEAAVHDAADATYHLAVLVHQHLEAPPASWALLPDGANPDDNGASLVAIAEHLHRLVAKAAGLLDVLAPAVRYEIDPFLPAEDEDGEADETE